MEDLAGGPREQIAAGAEASLLIKPFKATDQSNPGLLQQVVELFRPALLLATGRAVGQAQVFEPVDCAVQCKGAASDGTPAEADVEKSRDL